MGLVTIAEMVDILRKNFMRVCAFSLAIGILAMLVVQNMQTYTCTLNYKYNYSAAAEGFAPDKASPLNPYQIQEPTVIKGALNEMGITERDGIDVEKVRNNILISEVIEKLDQEVSDSAALLGEKYDVEPTEFIVQYTYDADWGEAFGHKLFDSLITQYDEYLLKLYYNKQEIADFMKIIHTESEDYLNMAEVMSDNIEASINYLDELAEYNPNYRSKRTGYTFHELAMLYYNLRDIQYAKYYGNIRAGNLSKDKEMVIKNYMAKVKELTTELQVNDEVSGHYFDEISTFYNAYKRTGLYGQAQDMQTEIAHSNNREQEILRENYELFLNTYDEIVLNYAESAEAASELRRDIEHYNSIISDFSNDTVPEATKASLIGKNAVIFNEIAALSTEYSRLCNIAIDELFDTLVNEDLLYLMVTDVQTDKPVALIAVFAFVVSFGLVYIFLIVKKIVDNYTAPAVEEGERVFDEQSMNQLQTLFYKQYQTGFHELNLVYQPMIDCDTGERSEYEAFIRWRSAEYGAVSAKKIIDCATDLGLLEPLNAWIIDQICQNLALRKQNGEKLPIIHVNCPSFSVENFSLADMIIKSTTDHGIDAKYLCMEIDCPNVMECMSDIMVLQKLGAKICIDRFEGSGEQEEIFKVLVPDYIKLSVDVVNSDAFATSPEEIFRAESNMLRYIMNVINRCTASGIKACICGIETKDQEESFVKGLGFAFKQGYLYGKPEVYTPEEDED